MTALADREFLGYRRENGRVGIRNHVAILPLDDLSNAACEKVANNIDGCLALPHHYGRLQFGEDLDLHFRTLIGTGKNPNVAACIVIGIEPGWTQRVVEGIAAMGKPVAGFAIERSGEIKTVAETSHKAQTFVQWATEQQRQPCRISLTGAEQVCAGRAATPEIGEKFLKTWQAYMDEVIEPHKTSDLSESQPTKGNIAGGLTTIEEKAFGNLQKIGKKTSFIDVLGPAEEPAKGAGLYFMDTSSAAAECVTLQAAAGFVVHLFPTGQGNIIGNPIEPVIKLTANPRTAREMPEHMDLDCSGILRGEMTLDEAGDALIDIMIRTCNGRLTAAETLKHREYVMTKLYRSA
jgi:(2R)-sulfolactate sulfo-lyase subunit beta